MRDLTDPQPATKGRSTLLDHFSLEMTGKDVEALEEAAEDIPPGTRINVTFLDSEDLAMRVNASRVVLAHGFRPVPHISARRLHSQRELEEFLSALAAVGASEEVFIVGGDPVAPKGPYEDSLAVIRTGLLGDHAVRSVGISGYPEGHPKIQRATLWQALQDKWIALGEQSLQSTVITQFGFDTTPVTTWLSEVRDRGIDSPVRVGVPGPAGVKRLLRYARRFGVESSAGIVHKYGFSLTNLIGTAGPDRFVQTLGTQLSPERHGEVLLHFYTFGGIRTTARWVQQAQGRATS